MSIEKDISRMADALETIASGHQTLTGEDTPAPPKAAKTAPPKAAKTAPPPPKVTKAAPPPPSADKPAEITVDELNALLTKDYFRLGESRVEIDKVMRSAPFNVTSVNDVQADQRAALAAACSAIVA